jgi:hypothetical protein
LELEGESRQRRTRRLDVRGRKGTRWCLTVFSFFKQVKGLRSHVWRVRSDSGGFLRSWRAATSSKVGAKRARRWERKKGIGVC